MLKVSSMTLLSNPVNGFLIRMKTFAMHYKLSEFIVSALIFQLLSIVVMAGLFAYGFFIESREIIVFTVFNGVSSCLLFVYVLWLIMGNHLKDRYYSWSIWLNYGMTLTLLPYALFIDHKAVVVLSMMFFFVNMFNLCILLHLMHFRVNCHHDFNALRELTALRTDFKFKLSMDNRLHVIMPLGVASIYFDTIYLKGVVYDLYHLTKYFKQHDLDLFTVTDDDLTLFEMVQY